MFRIPEASATTVFIASLTEAPMNGIRFEVANFIPRSVTVSLLAASEPLSVIMANKKDKEKAIIDTVCFFNDFTSPMAPSGGYRFSATNSAVNIVTMLGMK